MSVETEFRTISAFNTAYPHAAIPTSLWVRDRLRRSAAAGQGGRDHTTSALLAIDFVPYNDQLLTEENGIGIVIATHWGQGPIYVLAVSVPLAVAWTAVTAGTPTLLSEVREALARHSDPVHREV